MNANVIKNLAIFAAGVAVGAFVANKLLIEKYEQIAQEEINSVKEVFSKRGTEINNTDVRRKADQAKEKPGIVEYTSILQKHSYTNYSDVGTKTEEKKDSITIDKPYVISPDEFGEFDNYEKISLSYYTDKILADEDDELVEDVEDVVGFDSLNRFGEYEDDSVFVRNDRLKADYEILLDRRKYSDVIKKKPHQIEE